MAKKKAAKKAEDGPLPLIALEVENVLRLKSVNLKMVGDVLVVEGGNEQGKSSLLRVVDILLAGKDAKAVAEPLHGDAKKGHIVGTFGEYVVRKTFTQGRSPVLTIKSKTKGTLKAPQAILSGFLSHVTLDPVKFMEMSDREQVETLGDVMGFDSSDFDRDHDRFYEQRRDANRDVKRLQAQLDGMECDETAPKEEVNVTEVMSALEMAEDANRDIEEMQRQIRELHEHLAKDEIEVEELTKELGAAKVGREETKVALAKAKDRLTGQTLADTSGLKQEIADADAINEAVRAKARRQEIAAELTKAESIAERIADDLETVDNARESARLAARENLPLEDLDITEDAVLYKGKPLSQAGSSAQLRVSVAVAMGLNQDKRIRMLQIDNGEKLDAAHTRIVVEMAREKKFQVLMTRVLNRPGEESEGSVVIEDGKLTTE